MATPVNSLDLAKATEVMVAEAADCVTAQWSTRHLAATMGFASGCAEEIALVVAELTSNLLKHAGRGVLTLRRIERGGQAGVEIETKDHGPGIMDVERSFADGYSTKGTLGYGLGTVNRLMDEVDIRSMPGSGTQIVCRRWMQHRREPSMHGTWDVGVMTRSRRLAPENGDAFIVKRQGSELLAGVIDGLGHGAPAQTAALAAQHFVERHAELPLEEIFVGVSRACRGTRGVVMALVRFYSQTRMAFASVGNVEGRVWGSETRIPLLARRGILGVGEAWAHVEELTWNPRWLLVLHSDGLRTHWQWDDFPGIGREPAKVAAARLIRGLANEADDATVLAVRCEAP
jgi:anti-sigma regulatory factor (Ser/Thr protein kinase)